MPRASPAAVTPRTTPGDESLRPPPFRPSPETEGLKRFHPAEVVRASRPSHAPRGLAFGQPVSTMTMSGSTWTDESSVGPLLSSSDFSQPGLTPVYHVSGRPGDTLQRRAAGHAADVAVARTTHVPHLPTANVAPPRAMPRVIDCTQFLNNPDAAPDRGPLIAELRRRALSRYAAMKGLPLPPSDF